MGEAGTRRRAAPTWDDLRLFLAVARAESLTGAGRRLGLDTATVGRRLDRLEAALGARLVLRSPQGCRLTEAGRRLLEKAAAAELALEGALEAVHAGEGRLSGTVRVGAPDGCANFVLPQVCAAIADANPGLEIQIVALPRVFNLSRREADMAIAVSPPEAGRLTVQRICDYHLHLAASDGWLARHGPIRSRADLEGRRVIGYIPDMIFDRELDYLDVIAPDARAELASNSVTVQLAMIRHGAGVGIVHDFALPFAPEVRRVLAEEIALTRQFYLIRHAEDRHIDRLGRFAELLAAGVRREIRRLEAQVAAGERGPSLRPL
ncbi:MAG: LysR family transcriptional regulator [Alphaproteobacteria bacterium]|nr:MAG: LysR family transcriptional regulator [Alphaproteobacteria bacterium]